MTPSYEDLGKIYSLFFSPVLAQRDFSLNEMRRLLAILEDLPNSNILDGLREFLAGQHVDLVAAKRQIDWLYTEQDPWELAQMLTITRGKRSLIEVGSRFGGTLFAISKTLASPAIIVSVDAPMGDGGIAPHKPKESLAETAEKIRAMGHAVTLIDADSQRPETVVKVHEFGRFDFAFIDADHSYEGVRKDWENYGPLAKTVGFHDIKGEDGCARLWAELKTKHRHIEFINPDRTLGIGIIFQ